MVVGGGGCFVLRLLDRLSVFSFALACAAIFLAIRDDERERPLVLSSISIIASSSSSRPSWSSLDSSISIGSDDW